MAFLYSNRDRFIIFLIIIVFTTVFYVFYTEIIKNYKIKISKDNLDIVKNELLKEINQCKENKKSWLFGISCEQKPTTKVIYDFFNNNNKLTNPHDGSEALGGSPGSIQIDILDNLLVLSIDADANGGIDIEFNIYIN